MATEITKADRRHNTEKIQQHIYGRGSKAKMTALGDLVFTLIDGKEETWRAINEYGRIEFFNVHQIDKILVDGHWLNFDVNPRKWKRA